MNARTLLFRLAGPMQAWGTGSRFDHRSTEAEPSKSGVLGLVCAALGRDRAHPIDDLVALRMGVRVDREGTLGRDYQTTRGVVRADGSSGGNVQSWRYYLADAVFLVGLEAAAGSRLLEDMHNALRDPRWAIFLGRKGYLPSAPIYLPDGVTDLALEQALAQYPALTEPPPDTYRYVLESGQGSQRMDYPLAPFSARRFGARFVRTVVTRRGEVPRVPD